MKTLTIRQPHVAAIFLGLKPWETRSWRTTYRGPLAIHAGAAVDRAALERMGLGRVAWENHVETVLRSPARVVAVRAIIGVVDLVGCIPVEDVPPDERAWGDFTPGRFAWRLERPRLLRRPAPARGALSFWTSDVVDPWAA